MNFPNLYKIFLILPFCTDDGKRVEMGYSYNDLQDLGFCKNLKIHKELEDKNFEVHKNYKTSKSLNKNREIQRSIMERAICSRISKICTKDFCLFVQTGKEALLQLVPKSA